jgi:integrase
VRIENFKGRLRLRWSYRGKRFCLSFGFADSPLGRKVAEGKAKLIEIDLITGNFDPTLNKYRGAAEAPKSGSIGPVALFDKFAIYKAKGTDRRTQEKYRAVRSRVAKFFGTVDRPLDLDYADQFRLALADLAPKTQKEYLSLLKNCWEWGEREKLVTGNPWGEVVARVRVAPKQRPRPFTKPEIAAILSAFKSDPHYAYYADFVQFLFATGCRTSEAIGLRWCDLSDDCAKIWIGESVSRGVRKPTKTNRDRTFRLNPELSQLLLSRRPEPFQPDSLVFPSKTGKALNDRTFSRRAWPQILEKAGVNYRSPYTTRHTFVSHAIAQEVKPMAIAQITGHEPETLFRHYAADISGGLTLPNILD